MTAIYLSRSLVGVWPVWPAHRARNRTVICAVAVCRRRKRDKANFTSGCFPRRGSVRQWAMHVKVRLTDSWAHTLRQLAPVGRWQWKASRESITDRQTLECRQSGCTRNKQEQILPISRVTTAQLQERQLSQTLCASTAAVKIRGFWCTVFEMIKCCGSSRLKC